MGKMLEQLAPTQGVPHHPFAIAGISAPQDMIMGPHNIAHRVNLQEPQPPDDRHHIDCAG